MDANKVDTSTWRKWAGQKFLDIRASDHYMLGLLTGQHLSKRVQALKLLIEGMTVRYAAKKFTYKRLRRLVAQNYEKHVPKCCQEEMRGLAEATKRTCYEDVLLQNCFIDFLYGHLIPQDVENPVLRDFHLGCTSLGVVDHTTGMPLMAQNFDFSPVFQPLLAFARVQVGDCHPFFSMRIGGMLSLPAGQNAAGLAMTVCVVKSTIPGIFSVPCAIKARMVFENARSVSDALEYMAETPSTASSNILLADHERLASVEVAPTTQNVVEVPDYVVRSNRFTSTDLVSQLVNPKYSLDRQVYGEKRVGEIYERHGRDNHTAGKSTRVLEGELLHLLAEKPILREKSHLHSRTLAFISSHFFGRGNPRDKGVGHVPALHA